MPLNRHQQPYLTERIKQMVLGSQLHYKIVNLLFTITNQNNRLTVVWQVPRAAVGCAALLEDAAHTSKRKGNT